MISLEQNSDKNIIKQNKIERQNSGMCGTAKENGKDATIIRSWSLSSLGESQEKDEAKKKTYTLLKSSVRKLSSWHWLQKRNSFTVSASN